MTLFLSVSAFALDLPAPTHDYVNDYAGLLSASARADLESRLAAFDRETSTQILVITVPDLQGDTVEDFSIHLAEKWKPGSAKNDNGAILLISKEERAVRIEVGYGLEGALPDALAKRIIENEIVPRFRSGDFDGGVRAAVEAITAATRGEYTESSHALGSPENFIERHRQQLFLVLILYFVLPIAAYAAILGFLTFFLGLQGFIGGLVLILVLHALRWAFLNGSMFSGGRYGGGGFSGGGFGGGFSGGGFSGGGGSFGGGGASGRW